MSGKTAQVMSEFKDAPLAVVGQDRYGAYLMIGDYRCAMPNIESANRAALAWNCFDEFLSATKRAYYVLKAQGESIRPGNVLGALEAALAKAGAL